MRQIHFPETERVRELFDYHEDGTLTWKKKPNNYARIEIGSVAGYDHSPGGYRRVNFDKTPYFLHTVVWAWHNKPKTKTFIDHINGVKYDNRIENLREATNNENRVNSKIPSTNTTGYKGVYRSSENSWQVQIRKDKNLIHVGSFPTKEQAHEVYVEKMKELYGEVVETPYWETKRETVKVA